MTGVTSDRKLQESIAQENEIHHDLVQGDFLDTYRNLSYKNIMGQLWASEFCEQVGGDETDEVSADWLCVVKAQFILKTDDDQYVDLYEALVLASRYSRSEQYVKNRFLLCPVLRGLPILVTFRFHLANTELFPVRETRPASGMFPPRKSPARPSLISTQLTALVGSTSPTPALRPPWPGPPPPQSSSGLTTSG